MEIEPPDSLYGLYQGTPLPERAWAYGNTLPDRITIFQKPIEEDCEDEDEVRAVIGETLIHEVGHYFGLSEEEIEEIEEHYWRGETLGPDGGGLTRRARTRRGSDSASTSSSRPGSPNSSTRSMPARTRRSSRSDPAAARSPCPWPLESIALSPSKSIATLRQLFPRSARASTWSRPISST